MDKSYIFLKSPIGSGGEADIYTVRIRPELVAKVYKKPHGDYARKLEFMIANPPVDPLASSGRVSIAWATELVTDLGLVVGFLMPKLDTSKAKPIFQYYNPSERRKENPTFSYVSLMRTARNLARAVRSVHSRGYVIGDVNESNVLVAEDAIVTLVDTDSFQVNDGTTVYRCTVGKPEYTPPELQGMSFRDVDRSVEHDLFGLGVLIYQLLMEGTHPFGGVFTGQGEAPELKDRIKSGHFPHGRRRVPYKPMPPAPSFQMLPVALQELFLLCFEEGYGNPAARPTAEVWSKALGEAEDGLIKCGVNGQHFYSGHLGVCPWCERAVKLGGRDPFPALGAISSGQHLKPAAIGKAVEKPILKAKPSSPPPTRKPSAPNPVNSSVIPPRVVNATSLASSQPQPSSQPSISSNLVSGNSQISSSSTVANFTQLVTGSHWKISGISFVAYLITGIILAFTKQNIIVWGLIIIQTLIFSLSSNIKSFIEILNIWLRTFILIVVGMYVTFSTSLICFFIFNLNQINSLNSYPSLYIDAIASVAIVCGIACCMGITSLLGNAKIVIQANSFGCIIFAYLIISVSFIINMAGGIGGVILYLIILSILAVYIFNSFWDEKKLSVLRISVFGVCIFAAAYCFISLLIPSFFSNLIVAYVLTPIWAMSFSATISSLLIEEENPLGCMLSIISFFPIMTIAGNFGKQIPNGELIIPFLMGLCILTKISITENEELEKRLGKSKAKLTQLGICIFGLSVGLLVRLFL